MHVESWRSRELRMLILHPPFLPLPLIALPVTVRFIEYYVIVCSFSHLINRCCPVILSGVAFLRLLLVHLSTLYPPYQVSLGVCFPVLARQAQGFLLSRNPHYSPTIYYLTLESYNLSRSTVQYTCDTNNVGSTLVSATTLSHRPCDNQRAKYPQSSY